MEDQIDLRASASDERLTADERKSSSATNAASDEQRPAIINEGIPEPDTAKAENTYVKVKSNEQLFDMIVIDDSEAGKHGEDTEKEGENKKTEKDSTKSCEVDKRESKNNDNIKEEKSKKLSKEQLSNNKTDEGDSLSITADDVELDNDMVISNTEVIPQKTEETEKKSTKPPKKRCDSKTDTKKSVNVTRSLWIGNVSKSSKASDLKSLFSKCGKVSMAKIVTDGKHCYGYVTYEKPEDATVCLKTLKDTVFDGEKLSITAKRPDLKKKEETSTSKDTKPKKPPVKVKTRRISDDDPLTTKFPQNEDKEKRSPDNLNYLQEKRERLKTLIAKELEEKRRQRRKEMEQRREAERKLREQRRRLEQERELFERERREVIRLEQERKKIEAEKLEVMKAKSKLEEQLRSMRKKEGKIRKVNDEKKENRERYAVKSKVCEPLSKGDRHEVNYGKASPVPPPPPLLNGSAKHNKRERPYVHDNFNRRRENTNYIRQVDSDKKMPQSHGRGDYHQQTTYGSEWKRHSNLVEPHREPWGASSGQYTQVGTCATQYQQPQGPYDQQQPAQNSYSSGRCEDYYYHHRPHGVIGGYGDHSRCGQCPQARKF